MNSEKPDSAWCGDLELARGVSFNGWLREEDEGGAPRFVPTFLTVHTSESLEALDRLEAELERLSIAERSLTNYFEDAERRAEEAERELARQRDSRARDE